MLGTAELRCAGGRGVGVLATIAVTLLALASSASAANPVVKVGEPLSEEPPSIAVDSAGTAYIAWADTKNVAGAPDFVQYCVLPYGASACSQTGSLTPADSAAYIDRVQALVDGGSFVILADVYGAAGESAGEYVPEQEWQSSDGGATFSALAEGKSVANGILNADTAPLNAVIVPGSGTLGYGWDTAGGSPPTFDAFPLSAPAQCSTVSCEAAEKFAELQPSSNPDQIGNPHGEVAAQSGAHPGVLALYETDFSNGPLGCSGSGTANFGTAYAYGSGEQSASNSYDLSPGVAGSAWKVAVSQADCDVEYMAVAGGASGFGVLQDDLASNHAVYEPFDETTTKFEGKPATVVDEFEEQPKLSQDGAGGIFATFLGGGAGGPVSLAYSSDRGTSWTGPGVLYADKEGNVGGLTSAVSEAGRGWAAWAQNGAVYAEPFTDSEALAPAVLAPTATSTEKTITVTVTCASACTVTLTITLPTGESASVHKGKGKSKGKALTIAKGTFKIHKYGAQKLAVRLTSKGRKLLARDHGKLTASLLAVEKVSGLKPQSTSRAIRIKPGKKR